MAKFLQKLGYEPVLCADGLEALERIHDPFLPPVDACVVDILMPKLDGLQTTLRIREMESADERGTGTGRKMPILGLSGNARGEAVEEGLEAGMSDYLVKPAGVREVGEALRRLEVGVAGATAAPASEAFRAAGPAAGTAPRPAAALKPS